MAGDINTQCTCVPRPRAMAAGTRDPRVTLLLLCNLRPCT